MRRKLGVIEQAIRDAAKELQVDKDSWEAERLGTLIVMLKVARSKWQPAVRSAEVECFRPTRRISHHGPRL